MLGSCLFLSLYISSIDKLKYIETNVDSHTKSSFKLMVQYERSFLAVSVAENRLELACGGIYIQSFRIPFPHLAHTPSTMCGTQ